MPTEKINIKINTSGTQYYTNLTQFELTIEEGKNIEHDTILYVKLTPSYFPETVSFEPIEGASLFSCSHKDLESKTYYFSQCWRQAPFGIIKEAYEMLKGLISFQEFNFQIDKEYARLDKKEIEYWGYSNTNIDDSSKSNLKKIDLVFERLSLCNQLLVSITYGNHNTYSYNPLVVYLALTCFDILGSEDEWVDLQGWLESKKIKHIEERRLAMQQQNNELDNIEAAKKLWKYHNSVYGVKRSFYRFINSLLSADERKYLLSTLRITKQIRGGDKADLLRSTFTPYQFNNDELDEAKIKYLYYVRNSYTHNGSYIYSPPSLTKAHDNIWYVREKKITSQYMIDYYTFRWPESLILVCKRGLVRFIKNL